MNVREAIAENIRRTLEDMTPKPVLVERQSLDVDNLSRQQFPAIYITTDAEQRLNFTMGASSHTRQGIIDYLIVVYVTGTDVDALRNRMCEGIEEALAVDVTRGGVAHDTQTIEIVVDNDREPPMGEVTVRVRCEYIYTRGDV